MKNLLLSPWSAVLACAALSTLADTLGTVWWEQKKIWMLMAVIGLAPLVFLAFGYVGSHFGLAKASSLTNTLIVIGPVLVGISTSSAVATSPGPPVKPLSHLLTFTPSYFRTISHLPTQQNSSFEFYPHTP